MNVPGTLENNVLWIVPYSSLYILNAISLRDICIVSFPWLRLAVLLL